MNSTERENYEYLKARVVNLESDLRAAKSELEAAQTELASESAWAKLYHAELAELRRQIDGAAEITAEYFGDFVCWIPAFDEPTELKLNMQPGETRTFRLLEWEVKP